MITVKLNKSEVNWNEKTRILDVFVQATGYRRKYAIFALNKTKEQESDDRKKFLNGKEYMMPKLNRRFFAFGEPRMKSVRRDWYPFGELVLSGKLQNVRHNLSQINIRIFGQNFDY